MRNPLALMVTVSNVGKFKHLIKESINRATEIEENRRRMDKEMYVISWMQYITLEVDCWWRDLLHLPKKTVSKWVRLQVGIPKSEWKIEKFIHPIFFATDIQDLQMTEQYESRIGPIFNKSFSHSWEGFSWKGNP